MSTPIAPGRTSPPNAAALSAVARQFATLNVGKASKAAGDLLDASHGSTAALATASSAPSTSLPALDIPGSQGAFIIGAGPVAAAKPHSPASKAAIASAQVMDALHSLFPDAKVTISALQPSVNSRGAYRLDVNGTLYFVRDLAAEVGTPQPNDREAPSKDAFIRANGFTDQVASYGLGPKIVKTDDDARLRVTDFVRGAIVSEKQIHDPRILEAVLLAYAKLHVASQADERLPIDGEGIVASIDELVVRALDKNTDFARVTNAADLAREGARRLDGKTFLPALCHNYNQLATLFVDGEKIVLTDFDEASMHDPMRDLALFAFEAGFNMPGLNDLINMYYAGNPQAVELHRARAWLLMFHGRDYLFQSIGMRWHDPAKRDQRLVNTWRLVLEDRKLLHIAPPIGDA